MTDQQTYTKDDGTVLLEVRPDWRSAKNGKLLIKLPIVSDHDSVVIPAAELLAMIDRLDPDAMRAYLRETVEHEVPEADSPEDIDERPTPVTADWRLALLEQVRDLYPNLPPSRHIGVVQWVLEGTVLVERVERLIDQPAR